jgi:hypothetical protein
LPAPLRAFRAPPIKIYASACIATPQKTLAGVDLADITGPLLPMMLRH